MEKIRHFTAMVESWVKIKDHLHSRRSKIILSLVIRLPSKNLAYIGLRDVEKKEQELIEKLGIQAYGMKEVKQFGVEGIVRDLISQNTKQNYHISFDIDGLDITEAPSTGTRVEGGLTCKFFNSANQEHYQTGF